MKCVILSGGLGTRLSEETVIRPKPMIEIGWLPWEIYHEHEYADNKSSAGNRGTQGKF